MRDRGENNCLKGNPVGSYKKLLIRESILVMTMPILPKLKYLPATLPLEGAVRIELEEGIPIFRASHQVQNRIEELLWKQRQSGLSELEEQELDGYEEMDDYLSFVNRTIRNLNSSVNESGV